MAITININTPDTTININSSEDSGYIIPDQEPSKKTPKSTGPHFLVTDDVVKNINCDHRDENGNYDVSPDIELPHLYRCRRCGELIDLRDQYDPELVKKVIGYLWSVFQAMKVNNTDENLKKNVLDTLGISLYLLKENMPKTLEITNANLAKVMMSRNIKTPPPYTVPPYTPKPANDPFSGYFPDFSRFFDSKAKEQSPTPDPDKKDTQPKKDEKPPTKPRQQTKPFSE